MGDHGPDLFDDDVALEVQDLFEDALAEGLSSAAATRRVLEEMDDYLTDDEECPLVWLALAALQLEHGPVQPRVRRQALAVLSRHDGLTKWEDAEEDLQAEHAQVLATLQAQLAATPLPAVGR